MDKPILWHLKVSPYNEKARWALDFKRLPHVRRAVTPVRHDVVSRLVGGRGTMPVLVMDGRAIGDSSEIVEELERRSPEPPLHPPDPAERARALELEELFDEQLGPYMRRLVLHHALRDPDLLRGAFLPDLRLIPRSVGRAIFPLVRWKTRRDFRIRERTLEEAFGRLATTGERVRSELGPSGYLVGDSFSVADLTLASMCAPAVAPPEFPYPQPQRGHRLFAPLRDALGDAGLLDFTLRMYGLHRLPS
ncbi:MAG TPA: glutathione S-transferase N-terminal domain-containing protein [Thermoleophilaceae bacterium]|nr:glutathione S-transferase N-terminal domain-containing protein [Thermoleophilaceae bacterium]